MLLFIILCLFAVIFIAVRTSPLLSVNPNKTQPENETVVTDADGSITVKLEQPTITYIKIGPIGVALNG